MAIATTKAEGDDSARRTRPLDHRRAMLLDRHDEARLLLEMGWLAAESRPQLFALDSTGLELAEDLANLCKIPVSLVRVADLAPAWPGGPVFGAVAFDGSIVIDERMRELCGVSQGQFRELVAQAGERAQRLADRNHGNPELLDLRTCTAIIVDTGSSTAIAIRAAIASLRNSGARRVVVALTSSEREFLRQLGEASDHTYCVTLRTSCADFRQSRH